MEATGGLSFMKAQHQWADVAHYYTFSGIEISVGVGNRPFMGITNYKGMPEKKAIFLSNNGTCRNSQYSIGEYKPILRDVRDITEAEARELYTLITDLPDKYLQCVLKKGTLHPVSRAWFKKIPSARVILLDMANKPTPIGGQYSPKAFIWLLTQGFDIFGLIESGQAIRKEVQHVA
jgi:hypothetical protein